MIRNETARLLRRTAPALATLPLALALSGCGTLTGLNAENDFSCPMTPGVSCRSLSDTYEDSVRGRTPDRIERDKAIEAASKGLPEIEGTNGKAADETPAGPAVQTVKADAAQASVAAPAVRAPERRSSPKRLPEVIVTIWIAPWTDDEGDFHEGEMIHARAFDARWAAARRRAESADRGSAVVRLPFERRRSALKHAQTSVPRVRASESDVASSLGDGSRRFIEAQKAALKGTPYDPDVLAEKMKAPEENPFAKTRTCTTTCAVKLCKALGITEDELAASLLIAEPRHKHGSKLETPSKEAMDEVASTKARRKKDESDTEEECGTSTVSLKRPRRSSK